MNYASIRNTIMKNEVAFCIVRFFFTPIRIVKEFICRRRMANELIAKHSNVGKEDLKVFYFGIPEHNNLGDIAQTYCTRMWVNDNYPNRILIEAKTRVTFDRKFITFMENIISNDDLILFQSGYCTRHNNPDHLMHLHIAKKFSHNALIVLPQTVKLDDNKDVECTKKIFENCSRLRFITRDKISYKKALSFIDESRLACFPDIVTSLIGRIRVEGERKGVLLCVRDDDEKYYSREQLDNLKRKLGFAFERVDETDTNSLHSAEKVFKNLEQEINDKITQFAQYKCIITDRYHGTIFSLISNTPVIVIKTNDHKVTSAIEWFKGLYDSKAVRFASSLDEAYEMAKEIQDENIRIMNDSVLYERFYKMALKDLIDSI